MNNLNRKLQKAMPPLKKIENRIKKLQSEAKVHKAMIESKEKSLKHEALKLNEQHNSIIVFEGQLREQREKIGKVL